MHVPPIKNETALISNDDCNIRVVYKRFQHDVDYTESIVITNGYGSGGGSRTKSYFNNGFEVFITNKSQRSMSVSIHVTVFKNVESRLVGRECIIEISNLKPGYIKSGDLEIFNGEGIGRVIIERISIQYQDTMEIKSFHQFCSMNSESTKNLTPQQKSLIAINALLLKTVMVAIVGGVIWAAISNYVTGNRIIEEQRVRTTMFETSSANERRLIGTWYCADSKSKNKDPEPFIISETEVKQGKLTVPIKMHSAIEETNSSIEVIDENTSAAVYNVGTRMAINIAPRGTSSITLTQYSHTGDPLKFTKQIGYCDHTLR